MTEPIWLPAPPGRLYSTGEDPKDLRAPIVAVRVTDGRPELIDAFGQVAEHVTEWNGSRPGMVFRRGEPASPVEVTDEAFPDQVAMNIYEVLHDLARQTEAVGDQLETANESLEAIARRVG